MKKIVIIFCLCLCILKIEAQVKPASLAFHTFFTDFKTAQLIKASSLGNVLKNGSWSNFSDMQMGFGLSYFKGLKPTTDFVTTIDASSVDYTYKDGSTNGNSKFLFDGNAGVNLKLSDNSKALAPYLSGGVGFSHYKQWGIYAPVGFGLQVNVFNEAFITANMQYKIAASTAVSNHFYYNVGIGVPLLKSKKTKPIEKNTPVVVEPIRSKPIEIKVIKKDLRIKVIDELTAISLPNVMISLLGDSGVVNAFTNANGEAIFKNYSAGNYIISGKLNGINTTSKELQKVNFETAEPIFIQLSHNDPRFTLEGTIEEKNNHQPINGVVVNLTDKIFDRTTIINEVATDGKFKTQLTANSDFVLAAKKANYISNIEQISTKGLNRSTTLYVKLLLVIEEAKVNTTINLKNIYYATGSIQIKKEASSDLDRLVLFLTDNPSLTIEIASHTDSRGSASTNLNLSKKRAQEVVNYLVSKGISINRILAVGYGETRLLNECKDGVKCTEAQHEQNRRTEFKVIGN